MIVTVDAQLATLMDLRYKLHHEGGNGRPGGTKNCSGADGADCLIRVPMGTQILRDDGSLVADLDTPEAQITLAHGGRGGRGNQHYATASRRSPDFAQPGEQGQEGEFRLELKLLADVGLVGFPNAGKSTLISRLSRARPKIADYPFTTLTPNLGVVRVDNDRSYVLADIPGLIEGAAEGAGLGIRFLKHLERTRVFVFLLTQDLAPDRNPADDYRTLRRELGKYDPSLLERPFIVALNQIDRTDVREMGDEVEAAIGLPLHRISAVTGEGLDGLRRAVANALGSAGRWGAAIE